MLLWTGLSSPAPRCTSDLTGLDLLDCEPSAGLSCRFQCQPGLTLTLNTTLICTPGGQWNVNPDTLCAGVCFLLIIIIDYFTK